MASVSCSSSSPISIREKMRTSNSSAQKICCFLDVLHNTKTDRAHSFKLKAASGNRNVKPNSVICGDCDGNGAVQCSQCKGTGVNTDDFFNGQFKAGDTCWLCGGKKHMLCGNCNGAGFVGGFMSTYDE